MQAAPRPSSVRTGFIVFLSRWSVGPVVPVLPEDGSSSNLRITRILGGISRGHPATYDDRPAGQADRQHRADHPLLRGNRRVAETKPQGPTPSHLLGRPSHEADPTSVDAATRVSIRVKLGGRV